MKLGTKNNYLKFAALPFAMLCLAVPLKSMAATTNVVSLSSGKCLNVNGASTAPGTPIIQWGCDGGANSSWTLSPLSNGNYHIVALHSGQCLNVPGSSQQSGAQLIQWPCQGPASLNDQWKINKVSSSTYQIVSASSGQCVNIAGNSLDWAAAVIQRPCQNISTTRNDQFSLNLPDTATSALPSQWSSVIPLPVIPVGIANAPNGKILLWSGNAPDSFKGDIGYSAGQTYTALFDPKTNASTQMVVKNVGADMFCPGTAMLPNGNLLINGGSSSPKTVIYDWAANAWSVSGNMNIPRGYQGDTLLSNGNVFTLGGSWTGGFNSTTNPTRHGEVWNSGTGVWKTLSGVPVNNVIAPDPQDVNSVYRGDNHLWLFAVGGGMVFHAGPSAQMNWINTNNNGLITSAGLRGNDPYSMNGNAVMYDVGKILKIGGSPAYEQQAATNSAYVIDISGGPQKPVQVRQLPGMIYKRTISSSVVLPNGQVVIIGGQTFAKLFSDSYAVMAPEIWDPVTETFRQLKPMATARTYHSTAILMQDGRVFAGGGGLCGGWQCSANHMNAEILTPPYLLNADGSLAARPVIQSAPTRAQLGSTIQVNTQQPVVSFALVRLSAVTHSVNNDQRRIPLYISGVTPGAAGSMTYSLPIPADSGVVLPGYYMLFAFNTQGVPSVASMIAIN
jgi:galactose oxidase